ncbi:MAG: hypothetical protein J6A77_08390 [Lachnospiraceae bacterium]|nr:hypothetical protein [Lachnospiraceae bacterium]
MTRIQTTRFYAGASLEKITKHTTEQTKQSADTSRMFAGNFARESSIPDRIAEKRETAMEKAKKLLGDVFAAEKMIDDDLMERANRITESEQSIVEANKELANLREEQEKLKEQYGVTGTETEKQLPEEYKMQRDELKRYGDPYRQTIAEAQDVIEEERRIISAIQVERLKSDPMVAASKQAEETLESANQEIIGMLVDEVKETMSEHMEEAKEKQELEEKKQELEEAKREEREQRKEQAELLEVPVKELLSLEQVREEMKQEVDTMLVEMKLLAEDIKGSMVDAEL